MKALSWLAVPVLLAVFGTVYAYDAEMAEKIHSNTCAPHLFPDRAVELF